MKTLIYKYLKAPAWLVLLVCTIPLASCMKKPILVSIDSVKVGALKDSVIETTANFKVYNPNSVASTLNTSTIKTYFKDKVVGVSTLTKPVNLPAKDTVVIAMVTKVNLWNLAAVYPEIIASSSADFRIDGTTNVKALGIKLNIPVKDNFKLNVKDAIANMINTSFGSDTNFKIKQIKLNRLPGLSKVGFNMIIGLRNSFSFDYKLLGLNLDIYRKGGTRPLANWKMKDTVEMKAGASSDIPIAVEVDNMNMIAEARLSDILHPDFNVTVKGEAIIELKGHKFTIPVNETQKVDLNVLEGVHL